MQAYPLQWPTGYPRTPFPERARFDTSFAAARDGSLKEIDLLGGSNTVLSTNIPLRNDGLPYASFKPLTDKGVAIYFTYQGQQVVLACDKWDKVEHNMQAIRKAIEALRGLGRWGVSDMLKRAFTGFTALPASTKRPWWEVLEVNKHVSESEIRAAYHIKARRTHPDAGGSAEAFREVNEAYQEALKATGK